jgi:hypothetical protein
MESATPLFKNVVDSPSFWNQYFFDSTAILFVGFVLLTFLVLEIALIYLYVKRKSWWIIFASNLVTAFFAWLTTLYFLYPDLILNLVF